MASSRIARLCAALLLLFVATGARRVLTREQALAQVFPEATAIATEQFVLDGQVRAVLRAELGYTPRERRVAIYEGLREGRTLGHAIVMNEVGKRLPLTFLVALRPDGSVDQVVLMAFREPRGYEVEREVFRRQYAGRSRDDPIRRGRDIRNISGATLSVDAMNRGVRRALLFYALLAARSDGPES